MRTRDGAVRGNEGCRPGVWMTGCLRRGVNGLDAGGRRRGWSNGLQVGSPEVEGAGACRFQKLLGTQPGRAAFDLSASGPVASWCALRRPAVHGPLRRGFRHGLGREGTGLTVLGPAAAPRTVPRAPQGWNRVEGRMCLPQVLRAVTWAGRAAWREESGSSRLPRLAWGGISVFCSLGSAAEFHPGGVNPPEQPVQRFLDPNLKNMPARSRT
jgi:hypothetical protein